MSLAWLPTTVLPCLRSYAAKRPSPLRKRSVLILEPLEDRWVPSILSVNTTADSGAGSLRQAILDANQLPGLDRIAFNIGTGVQRIALLSALPAITDPVVIDGTTQPGFAGSALIVLNGANTSGGTDGLDITAGGSTIRGLVVRSFPASGIVISGPGGNVIAGNFIGTGAGGLANLGNGQRGVEIDNSSGNTIGGTAPGNGNLISANGLAGILITGGSNNTVQGNLIGPDVTGSAFLGNGTFGINIAASTGNQIGGAAVGAGNVIAANVLSGVHIIGGSSNQLQGNFIGTDKTGAALLGNGARGVFLDGSSGNTLGGTTAGAGNVISGNGLAGLLIAGGSDNVLQGNLIGTNGAGTKRLPNGAFGVNIAGSTGNQIGGTDPAARNVISGNLLSGVQIAAGSSGNVVQGNFIGTDKTGSVALGNRFRGVHVDGSTGNTVGGTAVGAGNLISGNDLAGIVISEGSGNVVQGNKIGTSATGAQALANGTFGINILGSSANQIGGISAAARNIVAGNVLSGIQILVGSDNQVQGNFIGTDMTGSHSLGNGGRGLLIDSSTGNTVGGTAAGAGNVIAGNNLAGVLITDAATNTLQGNLIGTDATGTQPLGNGSFGVNIVRSTANQIGGTGAGAGNIIAANTLSGLQIVQGFGNRVQGNFIGTNTSATLHLGNGGRGIAIDRSTNNSIGGTDAGAGNTIAFNTGIGVNIDGALAVSNSVLADAIFANLSGIHLINGANAGAVAPALTSGTAGTSTQVAGSLASTPNTAFRVEFFANVGTDASGNAEGQRFLGAATVTTDSSGHGTFDVTLTAATTAGEILTATATDPAGNTSEFSLGLTL
jgi:parallel beta-helix repeat protein